LHPDRLPGRRSRLSLAADEDALETLPHSQIRLRHVRVDAAIYPFLHETFRPAGEPEAAPYLDLTPFRTEEDYEKRYGKEQRRRRKRIRKELERIGPVKFELLTAGGQMDRAIDQALEQKRRWLTERGLYSRPIQCALIAPFLRELSRNRGGALSVIASRVTAGDRIISWEIGLRFATTHFGFITAHDTSLTDASPARLHMDLSQRRAITDGMKVFDLMVPADPHKESWSNGQIAVHDFHTPLSLVGRIYGRLYLEWLRPLLRRAYYWAPPALRALMTSFALLTF
jgi:CelD/BcsL family acetyltransferase involved in cellulose biosynthesis